MAIVWLAATLTAESRHIGVAFGLALCTTPLALSFAPLAVACLLRSPLSRRRRWHQVMTAVGIAVVGIVPFWLWSPQDFVLGMVHWFNDLDGWSATKWRDGHWWARNPGFAGLFWSYGWQSRLRWIQWAGVVAIAVGYHRRARSTALVPFFGALSFLWFMAFNHMLWPYFFHPVILLLALGWSGGSNTGNHVESWAVPSGSGRRHAALNSGPNTQVSTSSFSSNHRFSTNGFL